MTQGTASVIKSLRALAATLVVLALALPAAERTRGQSTTDERAPDVAVVLSGASLLPLISKGRSPSFHAVVVNRSSAPLVFVRPHADWPEEQRLEWHAYYSDKRAIARFPDNVVEVERLPNDVIWCDPHGVMRAEPAEFFYASQRKATREIQDADLVVLQPGESYEIPGLSDPTYVLKFLNRGAYGVNVSFEFDPTRYRLAAGSKYAVAFAQARAFYLSSNTLSLTLD